MGPCLLARALYFLETFLSGQEPTITKILGPDSESFARNVLFNNSAQATTKGWSAPRVVSVGQIDKGMNASCCHAGQACWLSYLYVMFESTSIFYNGLIWDICMWKQETGQATVIVEEDMQRKRLLMHYSKFRTMASRWVLLILTATSAIKWKDPWAYLHWISAKTFQRSRDVHCTHFAKPHIVR